MPRKSTAQKSAPRKSTLQKSAPQPLKKTGPQKAAKKAAKKDAKAIAASRNPSGKNSPAATQPDAQVPIVKTLKTGSGKRAKVLSSELRYEGPLFRVYSEQIREPNGKVTNRDIIRHHGSVVILPIDPSRSRRDPLVVIERQYRHAAGQFLYEVPAGKMEPGENRLRAAKRELLEETGYTARKWTHLARYFASPGFVGEWMQVFLAEDLIPGPAQPEENESIELLRVPLSELLRLIEKGQVQDGKTLVSILSYARSLGKKR